MIVTITLTLSAEKQAELERRAAAAGTDVAQYVLDVVQEKLDQPVATVAYLESYDDWKRALDEWVSRQKSWNPNFDDSRESIYD